MKRRFLLLACAASTIGSLVDARSSYAAKDVFLGSVSGATVPWSGISHAAWNQLLQKYVDSNGLVDYRAWKSSRADQMRLSGYLTSLSKASGRDGTREQQLAFWINAYNAVTIHGILREYPTTSIRNHTAKLLGYNIWKNLKLYVGGTPYSLDQMEHEILRKMDEPRIHFAIVCASVGCPRLLSQAYVAERLEEQLTLNATDFFSRQQNFQHDVSGNTFKLSSLLNWFASDFGRDQKAQLKRMSEWLPTEDARSAARRGTVRIAYLDYDWGLNAQR